MVDLNSVPLRRRVHLNKVSYVTHDLGKAGQVFCKVGQELQPQDIVGESFEPVGFCLLNLPSELQVGNQSALAFLQKSFGQTIYKGELLASRQTVFGLKKILSPEDVILDSYDVQTGELRLKYLPRRKPIVSGVYGIVGSVENNIVQIKTLVTEIYGLIGSGLPRFGAIRVLGRKDNLLSARNLTDSFSHQILVAGALCQTEAFKKAVSLQIKGLIVGGINAKDAKAINGSFLPDKTLGGDIGLSILVTEGYGPLPLADDLYTLLEQSEGHFGFIQGEGRKLLLPSIDPDSIIKLRRVALPRVIKEESRGVWVTLTAGMKVRICRPPFMATQARVLSLDQSLTTLPSGVVTRLVTIESPNRRSRVPIQNLEVLNENER